MSIYYKDYDGEICEKDYDDWLLEQKEAEEYYAGLAAEYYASFGEEPGPDDDPAYDEPPVEPEGEDE